MQQWWHCQIGGYVWVLTLIGPTKNLPTTLKSVWTMSMVMVHMLCNSQIKVSFEAILGSMDVHWVNNRIGTCQILVAMVLVRSKDWPLGENCSQLVAKRKDLHCKRTWEVWRWSCNCQMLDSLQVQSNILNMDSVNALPLSLSRTSQTTMAMEVGKREVAMNTALSKILYIQGGHYLPINNGGGA